MKSLILILFTLIYANLVSQTGWVEKSSGTISSLYSVCFTSVNTGYASGADGIIIKTTDAGESWTVQPSGITNSLYWIDFLNDNTGWTVGYQGKILKTTNGGSNWVNVPTGIFT